MSRESLKREVYKYDASKYNDISDLKTETIDYKNETQL